MQERKTEDRRGFGKQVLGSLLTYSMLETVMASGAHCRNRQADCSKVAGRCESDER